MVQDTAGKAFNGVKIALLHQGKLVVYLRDDKPGLRFAGLWDLPGGGREGDETPFECVRREVEEEFGFTLQESQLLWQRQYPAMHDPSLRAVFMVADISGQDLDKVAFGSEGQRWKLMTVEAFLSEPQAVSGLQAHLRDYLSDIG